MLLSLSLFCSHYHKLQDPKGEASHSPSRAAPGPCKPLGNFPASLKLLEGAASLVPALPN